MFVFHIDTLFSWVFLFKMASDFNHYNIWGSQMTFFGFCMKWERLWFCLFYFQIPVAWGETRSTEILQLKHSELPNSYMAEIFLCVGGFEHDLVGITQKAHGWLGNLDNELASCVSSENRLGVHALNSPPAAGDEDKWPERFGEDATSQPRASNESNLILSFSMVVPYGVNYWIVLRGGSSLVEIKIQSRIAYSGYVRHREKKVFIPNIF